MAQIDLIQGKWCDIVFEGKNKEYGAYPIRKATGKRNVIAIISILVLIALCIGGIQLLNVYQEYQKRQEALRAEMELSKLQEKKQTETKKEEVEKVIKQPEQKVVEVKQNTIKFTEPVIKKDDEVKEENTLLNMEDLNKDNRRTADESYDQGTNQRQEDYGALTIEEEKVAPPPPPPAPEPEPEQKVEENKVYDVVEQQPTFNGNINSWLASNLKYPPVAAENGIEGRVIVQFVVGKDGSIHSAQVVRGVDSSLDKEALRVVNSMPKWVPGKQNGQSVNCKFTLPVVFKLQ